MDNKMYICYASSDFYARETGISLLGLLDNNPGLATDKIFILDYGITDENKKKINNIVDNYDKKIEYLSAKSILENIQFELKLENFRGSLATYSRAFIDKLIPVYVKKLLYIDSDTVVTGDVTGLEFFDMGDCCMAGAAAVGFYDGRHSEELELISGNTCYYSCGIVLFDLNNWKKRDCFSMMADVLKKKDNYPYADQTLINNAIPEKWLKLLPIKYNYTSHIFNAKWRLRQMKQGNWYSEEEILECVQSPSIVHYPGNPLNRPWYKGCLSDQQDVYLKYRNLSPWKEDLFLDVEDYEKSIKGVSAKFNQWIHKQEMVSSSYSWLKFLWTFRSIFGKVYHFLR